MVGLRIGVLGAARIANEAIIDPANVVPRCRITAIAARDRSRAEAFAAEHNVPTVLDDYQSVIASDDIDLVYNPLPIHLHAEWTIKALEWGKHVLCEKPFAMNLEEARLMQLAADQNGKRLIEAFHYRYHPAFEICLEWLANDEIGELKEIHATFNVSIKDDGHEIRHRVETGGGAMMDLGCYPLQWALATTGETPSAIQATATLTPVGVDESMRAELTFPSGVVAHLEANMGPGVPFQAELKLIGTKGEIEFVNPLAPHNQHMLGWLRSSHGRTAKISPISTYTYQLGAVFNAIDTGEPLPTEGEMVLRQQAALDGIYEAAGLRHLRYLSA